MDWIRGRREFREIKQKTPECSSDRKHPVGATGELYDGLDGPSSVDLPVACLGCAVGRISGNLHAWVRSPLSSACFVIFPVTQLLLRMMGHAHALPRFPTRAQLWNSLLSVAGYTAR
jgi:hypothetical protein